MPTWATEFRAFSWMHAITLAWTLGALAISCWLGRRWRERGEISRERALGTGWGVFGVSVNLWNLVYWVLPGRFVVTNSLPLHVCDLACLATPLVFLAEWRWARVLVYFWGLGLSSQAFITPTVRVGPVSAEYWLFWLVHLTIVGSSVYDMVVRGFRPRAADFGLALVASLAYLGMAIGVNAWLGSNYGYVGDVRPGSPTVIDQLGPWPRRIVFIAGIAIGWMFVLWVVWPIGARLLGRRMTSEGTDSARPRGLR